MHVTGNWQMHCAEIWQSTLCHGHALSMLSWGSIGDVHIALNTKKVAMYLDIPFTTLRVAI